MVAGYRFVVLIVLLLLWLLASHGPVLSREADRSRLESCRTLVAHLPDPDPQRGADYRAGRDVRGRTVAPADLDDSVRLELPETFLFDLEIRPIAGEAFEATSLPLGTFEIHRDGRVYFNDRLLGTEERFELWQRCQRILQEGR